MSGFGEHYLPKKEVEQTAEEIAAAASTENTDNQSAASTEGAAQTDTKTTTDTATQVATIENTNTIPPAAETVTSNEVTFDAVKEFLAKNGITREFNSVEDFIKPIEVEKIVEKEVNKWESILDDEDKAYLDYKQETGRTRKEFEFLKKDINSFDLIELSIERIKKDTGREVSRDNAIAYLENKFNLDLTSSTELDVNAQIELEAFSKPIKEDFLKLQEKYGKASENKPQTQNNNNGIPDDVVVLENGTMMKKDAYQELLDNHAKHIEAVKNSVNGVTESQVKVLFDENGSKVELSYGYEYANEDRQSMVSAVSDLNSYIAKNYETEQGLNQKQLTEDVWWLNPKNREKAISSMIHKAIAENTENLLKSDNNVNFQTRPLHNGKVPEGVTIVPLGGPQEEVGMLKYFQPKP